MAQCGSGGAGYLGWPCAALGDSRRLSWALRQPDGAGPATAKAGGPPRRAPRRSLFAAPPLWLMCSLSVWALFARAWSFVALRPPAPPLRFLGGACVADHSSSWLFAVNPSSVCFAAPPLPLVPPRRAPRGSFFVAPALSPLLHCRGGLWKSEVAQGDSW